MYVKDAMNCPFVVFRFFCLVSHCTIMVRSCFSFSSADNVAARVPNGSQHKINHFVWKPQVLSLCESPYRLKYRIDACSCCIFLLFFFHGKEQDSLYNFNWIGSLHSIRCSFAFLSRVEFSPLQRFEFARHIVCSNNAECFYGMLKHAIFRLTSSIFRFFAQFRNSVNAFSNFMLFGWVFCSRIRLLFEQHILASCDLRWLVQTQIVSTTNVKELRIRT